MENITKIVSAAREFATSGITIKYAKNLRLSAVAKKVKNLDDLAPVIVISKLIATKLAPEYLEAGLIRAAGVFELGLLDRPNSPSNTFDSLTKELDAYAAKKVGAVIMVEAFKAGIAVLVDGGVITPARLGFKSTKLSDENRDMILQAAFKHVSRYIERLEALKEKS